MIKKRIFKSGRNYRLDIPVIIMKSMGWEDDAISIEPDPVKNEITLKNLLRKPVGFTQFCLNVQNAKWVQNKKKYQRELNKNLSSSDRKTLHTPKFWEKIEDGGYWNVKLNYDFSEDLKKQEVPKEFKEIYEILSSNYKELAKIWLGYLEKKHKKGQAGKKPRWVLKIEKEIKNIKDSKEN